MQPQEVQLQTRPRRDGPATLQQHEPSTLASVLASLTYVLLCAKCKHFINREAERQKTTRLARHCTQRSQALPLRPGAGTPQVSSPAPCPAQTCPGAGADGIGFWQRVGEGCLTPRPPFTCGSLAQTVATVSSSGRTPVRETGGVCASRKHLRPEPRPGCPPQPALAGRNLLAWLPDLEKLRQPSLCAYRCWVPVLGYAAGTSRWQARCPSGNRNPPARSHPPGAERSGAPSALTCAARGSRCPAALPRTRCTARPGLCSPSSCRPPAPPAC